MSNIIYLQVDDVVLPVEPKHGYEIDVVDFESINETEAGTRKRAVYRSSVPKIAVSFWCNLDMLQQLRALRNKLSVTVKYFDPLASLDLQGNRLKSNVMFITNYKENMLADSLDFGIWEVGFDLEDLSENV